MGVHHGQRGGYLKHMNFSASWHETPLDGYQYESLHCIVLEEVVARALRNASQYEVFPALVHFLVFQRCPYALRNTVSTSLETQHCLGSDICCDLLFLHREIWFWVAICSFEECTAQRLLGSIVWFSFIN